MKGVPAMTIARALSLVSVFCCLAAAPTFASEPATRVDKPPTPVRTPPPAYPQDMRGTAGIVSLVVVVGEDGSVVEASVAKSSDAAFEAPSLEAISKWKFKPAEVNGQPVKCKITLPIRFDT